MNSNWVYKMTTIIIAGNELTMTIEYLIIPFIQKAKCTVYKAAGGNHNLHNHIKLTNEC